MKNFNIASGSSHGQTDTERFLQLLDSLAGSPSLLLRQFFGENSELIVTRAPGRLDVMGGIADYSGSLVLQLPIADAAHVALQRNGQNILRITSLPATSNDQPRHFEMPLEDFLSSGGPIDYRDACLRFKGNSYGHWAAYVAGAFLVLMHEKKFEFTQGANILISSAVPEGKGVSSSAALEVAAMQAIVKAFGIEIASQELALLCQKVENLVAGAPCGVMDQMTAACGESGRLLELVCQRCDLKGTLTLPEELEVWGLDSGIRHSVGGSDYTTVRTATFMGYRMIAELAGFVVQAAPEPGKVRIEDHEWNGYLANISPSEFEREYSSQIPRRISGNEFLQRYGGITDPVTSVRPEVDYAVWQATQHPIQENSRVQSFADILKTWQHEDQAEALGELMFQSHDSYSSCGLGTRETDLLVQLVKESRSEGLFGARITGGGSGGAVAVLGRRGADQAIIALRKRYHLATGIDASMISGSSPGASRFGHLTLMKS